MEDALDFKPFFEEAVKNLKEEMPTSELDFYLSGLEYNRSETDTIVVNTPSLFFRDQLKKAWVEKIEEKLHALCGRPIVLSVEALESMSFPVQPAEEKKVIQDTPRQTPTIMLREDGNTKRESSRLNGSMTFENYVIGEENKLAYSTAIAIAKSPGGDYNPFLIYGGVGLGKTHLMHAIGNHIQRMNPSANILCIPSEAFVSDFVNHVLSGSIKNNTMKKFKDHYRNLDVLLLDDIHDLQGKDESQEELFHTFNQLYDNKKQLIFTCDRPPTELKKFNERLISRFVRGFKIDLRMPSYETRLAILKKKSESFSFAIPDDVLNYIATSVSSNVRDLESALTNIKAYAELVQEKITLAVAQKAIKPISASMSLGTVTIDMIQKVTAAYFNVTTKDLKDKRKNQAIVLPRQVAMFIAREMTEFSTTEIGLEFGGRDHTTVMHSVQKIDSKIKVDPKTDMIVQSLIRTCREQSQHGS